MRGSFYAQLRAHYSTRKYREQITLNCANKCLSKVNFREDDLSRSETECHTNCFHKHYRYLAYSNTLYSYLTSEQADEHVYEEEKEVPKEELYA